MLSDADYKELKAQEANLNDKGKAALRDYDMLQAAKEPIEAPSAVKVTWRAKPSKPAALYVPELPPEQAPSAPAISSDLASHGLATGSEVDDTMDSSLPNASKLKALYTPPEYVAKSRMNGVKHIAAAFGQTVLDTTAGGLMGPGGAALGALRSRAPLDANMYYEPSEEQFMREQKPVIEARKLVPGSDDFQTEFDVWKDKKWKQAYHQAEAEDRPLTRVEHVADNGSAWDKLKNYVEQAPDVAQSFAKGAADFLTLQQATALPARAEDWLTGSHKSEENAAQEERNPIATGAGELAAGVLPVGPVAETTGFVGKKLLGAAPGPLRKLGSAMAAGAAGAVTDLAGRAVQRGEETGSVGSARDRFMGGLLPTLALGSGMGAIGHVAAEGANSYQKWVNDPDTEIGRELPQIRLGGGETTVLKGLDPGAEVAANREAARAPIVGENKTVAGVSPSELAAQKVATPLAEANAAAHTNAHATIAAEQDAAIAANPKLQEQLPATKTAQAAVDWALAKLQPEARPGYLPGVSKPLSADVLPGADIAEVQKLAPRLWKPRLVTAVDAESIANKARGRAITLDEAQRLGLDVPGLSTGLNSEGVPLNAPPIPEAPISGTFEEAAKRADEIAARTGAHDALNTFLNERRATVSQKEFGRYEEPNSDAVSEFLRHAQDNGATYDGTVYRGMTHDELNALLREGQSRRTWSVSRDADGAQHAARRGGVLLQIEGSGAVPVDGIQGSNTFGEALVPRDTPIEVVSSEEVGGITVVKARRTEADKPAGATAKDVFGSDPEKLEPLTGPVRGATPGRAKPPPTPEPGSDWDNPDEARTRFDWMYGNAPSRPEASPAKPDDVTPTRLSENVPRLPRERWATPSSPSGPPASLRGTPPPAPPSGGPPIGGIPRSEYRVILEPRRFDAKTFEEILGDVDRKAKAGSATATPDPAWKQLQRAIREDRSQFGKDWTDLIAKHHDLLTDTEQRSYHAGIAEKKPEGEMQGSSQASIDSKLAGFPGGDRSAKALRELAAQAGPKVQHDLEVLGAQNAYARLKGSVNPRLAESFGPSGLAGHLRGFGPAVKLRADAVARGVSAGPTGEPTIGPALADFVRQNAPRPRPLTGITAMGGGALGMKAGNVYNSTRGRSNEALTPAERQFLEKLIEAQQEAP